MSDIEKNDELELNEATPETEGDATETAAHDHDHDHGHDHGHAHDHDHGEEKYEFAQDPAFEMDYKGDCAYDVKVTVAAVNLVKETENMFGELQESAELPGFRRGKAPLKLLQNKFSKAVRGDAAAKLVEESFKKLIDDKDLHPINRPEVEGLQDMVAKLKEGDDLAFTLSFEVAPRCELAQYRGVEVIRPVVHVEDKDVDEVMDGVRGRMAVYETVEEAAQDGDQALIDFEGTIDGQPFVGNSAENYPYIMGSGRFLKEFEEALAGKKAGETAEADVTFPEDWRNEELAGKVAHFTIKVNEIKRKRVPEFNDELAKEMGHDSLQAWRDSVADRLKQDTLAQSDRFVRSHAMSGIIDNSTFEIPKSLLAEMTNDELNAIIERERPGREIFENEEELAKLRERAAANALFEIKMWTAHGEIAEAEGITVTEEDLEREAESMAGSAGVAKNVALSWMMEESRRSATHSNILQKKVQDLVLAHAKIVEKELTDDEAEDAEKAEDAPGEE